MGVHQTEGKKRVVLDFDPVKRINFHLDKQREYLGKYGMAPPLPNGFFFSLIVSEWTGGSSSDLQRAREGGTKLSAIVKQRLQESAMVGYGDKDGMGGRGLFQIEMATYNRLLKVKDWKLLLREKKGEKVGDTRKYARHFTQNRKLVDFHKKIAKELPWSVRAEMVLMHHNYETQYKNQDFVRNAIPEGSREFYVYMAALHNMGSPVTAYVKKYGADWERHIPDVHRDFLRKFRQAYFNEVPEFARKFSQLVAR